MLAVQHVSPDRSPSTVEFVAVEDSKITAVSLYSGLAEITRLFLLDVSPGQNNVIITGLPASLDRDTLR